MFVNNRMFLVADLKQELMVKEKQRCPDNERPLSATVNGFKSPVPLAPSCDTNRLRESETQTSTPLKRKISKTLRHLVDYCSPRKGSGAVQSRSHSAPRK